MRTDHRFNAAQLNTSTAPIALFLFAHQDDEFGVFQRIVDELQRGRRVICMYLTSGVPAGADPARRNAESLAVLHGLGVAPADICFAGHVLAIPDGALQEHVATAATWLSAETAAWHDLAVVYLLAWEGGHPDHDVLHAIGLQVFGARRQVPVLRQFALYNGNRCPWQFFRVLSPLALNGAVETTTIPWQQRLRFLRLCLRYPSQRMTWIGLLPFVLLHYLFDGRQALQPVAAERVLQRPHAGPLYYEKRGFSTWQTVQARLAQWRAGLP
ncbi:PIG-L deacetylase family protein [Janthinobacterium sp. PSPC3-1]|uniref:PIG-L deacetylase family protein n=1 Tax=Janthinobacterium sp. PSPC3-1 TaxID=2804653 RepID=UPI003CEB33DE